MTIVEVRANNRKRALEVQTEEGQFDLPYARLELKPSADDPIVSAWPDEETACEAFTYRLRSGKEETVHLDVVLEFNRHPGYLNDLLLHRLTVEAIHALDESDLSKRELTRRLGTSASQLYRLLDPTNTAKSIGQMLALLRILGREVDFVVRPGTTVRNVAV
ncbi:hypothetical protein [Methanocorpusculum sp. GPch4]|uniref:hypothetical protein n=1 Tax=Methanocorpusculum sp. GPch4 TaxID=2527877 RepID=UPI00143284D2|nr:hypothetical protein [Methanocorpusculum sp. GPch4]